MEQLKHQMHELQKQAQNREMVYNNLLRDKQLEEEHHERIRKQFLQKQLELEYVVSLVSCFLFSFC